MQRFIQYRLKPRFESCNEVADSLEAILDLYELNQNFKLIEKWLV